MSETEVILLPSVPSEYAYVRKLSCQECGEEVQADRRGSSPASDGRMHDFWQIRCTRCAFSKNIILSVPGPDLGALLDQRGGDERRTPEREMVGHPSKPSEKTSSTKALAELLNRAAQDSDSTSRNRSHDEFWTAINLSQLYLASGEKELAAEQFRRAVALIRQLRSSVEIDRYTVGRRRATQEMEREGHA